MKTRVLHIVYSGFGGTTDYVFNLLRGDKDKTYGQALVFFGIEETHPSTLAFARELSSSVEVIIKKQGRDRQALEQLGKVVADLAPATVVLHVNSLVLDLHKWLPPDTRFIFVEHQASHLKTKKEWVYTVLAQRRANMVVSLTDEAQRRLKHKLGFLFRPSRNAMIRTGIVLEDYSHQSVPGKKRIGMIGRINPLRDHETLIRAFLELPDADTELHLAGDGPLLEPLKEKYGSERVIFHGLLDRQGVIDFLAGLTIYVQASLGETSSVALLQAQASHLPIIASDVPGISNVLDEQLAILVPPGDVSELKKALHTMISKPKLAQQKAKAGYLSVSSYTNREMFEGYKKLFA